jgi:hypothetical protein
MTRPTSVISQARRPGRKARRVPCGCRPRLEHLEGRLAPATFVVNSAQDVAAPPPGVVTLRSALLAANADPSPDTISFDPSLARQTITLSLVGDGTAGPSALAVGGIGRPSAVTIDGGAAPGLALSGPGGSTNLRLFFVAPGSSLTLEDLTLSDGQARGGNGGLGGGAAGLGGAVLSEGGALTVQACTFTANLALGGEGYDNSHAGNPNYPGGGGLAGPGSALDGGGPNGGAYPGGGGGGGGFGGGAAGSAGSFGPSSSNSIGGPGGAGGFGGGGGGGGNGGYFSYAFGTYGGLGGRGGFGGGGGGGGNGYRVIATGIRPSGGPGPGNVGGFGGGNGAPLEGGGGAGMGGAIFCDGGSVTALDSTFYGNTAQGGTGANPGSGLGGAIFSRNGAVIVSSCTLDGNAADQGGGFYLLGDGAAAVAVVNNTILAGTVGGSDFVANAINAGTISVGGAGDLVQAPGAGAGQFTATLTGQGPRLRPLRDNGGPTPTLEPLAGSPVLDAGVTATVPTGLTTDQRGQPRVRGGAVDIGSVEPQPAAFGVGSLDPATATWYLRSGASPGAADAGSFRYGGSGWLPVSGDWSGAGAAGVGAFDPSTATWYLRNQASAGAPDAGEFQFGGAGWAPVAGDWANSGHTGVGAFDPSTATWYLRGEATAGAPDAGQFQFGVVGGVPVVGDWAGTGHLGIGVFDPATFTWYLRSSATPGAPDVGVFCYGGVGFLPAAGDWSGTGHAGIGVIDPSTGTWYLRNEPSAGVPGAGQFAYGGAGWLPVCGAFAAPQFLLAQGGEGPGSAGIGADQLQAAVAGALARLSAAGVDPALVGSLAAARYDVAALPPGVLGRADVAARHVTLSADAAGYGWFVDPTPLQDEEFAPGAPAAALPGSAAAGREDLLSAVLHEMGHLAGRPGADSGLMAGALAAGTRDLAALDSVFAGQAL